MHLIRTALIALSLLTGAAQAQNYPDRTIRILVGFTPGSATDISARMFAQKLGEAWSVPVTVENLPGAGGSVGGERVAKSAPDGYTLYWGANGALTINPSLQTNPTFEPLRDLSPVARLLVMPSILAVNNDVPAKSVAELIALARAKPGTLSYASPGAGTPQHIAGEVFKSQLGLDIVHVPYRGANFTDVIGGRVTMTFQNTGAILPTVREGKLRGLAVTSLTRSTAIPELPTMIESGVADFEATSWFGLLAPAGTPAPIIAKLYRQATEIVQHPQLRESFGKIGLDVVTDPPDVFAGIIRTDTAKWAKVIREAGIKGSE
ncbi:MAG: tripartite tricarboxylate transporter substrate binding protein [Alphaproteobacteria bacterium]|nr:MAG: tripartite tricarboxylate transporter substrate binding protein [Alphaproteobacteria bacterium]